ncbi:DUF1684 domain-containing protein [Pseudonocardia sichuanensis]
MATISGSNQTVEGVPGHWNTNGSGGLEFTAAGADGVSLDGRPVDGTVALEVGSELKFPGERSGIISGGGGTHGLVVRAPAAAPLAGLREIAVYPVDPDYIVEAEYRRTPGRVVEVGRLTDPPSRQILPAPADLVFDLKGERYSLTVIESLPGQLLVVFTDATSGSETPEIGRWVVLPSAEEGTVRVDFNRVVLPLHAFSPAFPCPLAPEGNHLPVPVRAGERTPVYNASNGANDS